MKNRLISLSIAPLKAFLVGLSIDHIKPHVSYEENPLDELEGLATTCGYTIANKLFCAIKHIDPKFFITKGKTEYIRSIIKAQDINIVIFDEPLSPAQNQNLEAFFECSVIDRTGLILEIFNKHARTKEAKTQVELAHLNYLLPRLTRRWGHLSRQRGGIGLRDVGEKQLELDRRIIKRRIAKLEKDIEHISNTMSIKRKRRRAMLTASILGYTNTGKTTLMNSLTNSNLLVEDKVFATLDTTHRIMKTSSSIKVIIADTVGFINKLPHHLIASFKSTLDEVKEANLLIKVVDISNPSYESQMKATENVLLDLGLQDKDSFWVFNKVDKSDNQEIIVALKKKYKDAIFTSGINNSGIEDLRNAIISFFEKNTMEISSMIPYSRYNILSTIYNVAHVMDSQYYPEGICIRYRIFKTDYNRLSYILS